MGSKESSTPLRINRREFLNLAGMGALWLGTGGLRRGLLDDLEQTPVTRPQLGRVARYAVDVHYEPDLKAPKMGRYTRDQVISLDAQITSPSGPVVNPTWYRVDGGYVHSAYIQPVEVHLQEPVESISPAGMLAEVSVPFTQSYIHLKSKWKWQPTLVYYYESVYWVERIVEGPDGGVWYETFDERSETHLAVPAAHLRPVLPEELTPISPDVPPQDKKIVVFTRDQTLTAYEAGQEVYHARISTGRPTTHNNPNLLPTETPVGWHIIGRKMPSRHMGDGFITSDPDAYELPGVPWVSYFHITGVAFHGTYWHNNFGAMMSRGCVNLRNADAKWIYRWSTPYLPTEERNGGRGKGTRVQVLE